MTSWSILRFQATQTLPPMTIFHVLFMSYSCSLFMYYSYYFILFMLCLFIVCETMFTIGESRTISHSNDTELQAPQVPANPRRGRFSIETPLENAE